MCSLFGFASLLLGGVRGFAFLAEDWACDTHICYFNVIIRCYLFITFIILLRAEGNNFINKEIKVSHPPGHHEFR